MARLTQKQENKLRIEAKQGYSNQGILDLLEELNALPSELKTAPQEIELLKNELNQLLEYPGGAIHRRYPNAL